jgi:autotransporter-associated beta strand protein
VINLGVGYAANLQWNNTTKAVELNVNAAPGAVTYYWDNNGATAGFGAAAGTWASPTTGDATQGWSTDGTGGTLPASVTTAEFGSVNFGNGTTGLGAGAITVSGSVTNYDMTFASGSGAIVLSGGTINFPPSGGTITVNNTTDTISSVLAGSSLTKAGAGTLVLSGINTYSGNTIINSGKLQGVVGGSSASSTLVLGASTAISSVAITDNTKEWTNAALKASGGVLEFSFGAVTPSTTVSPLKITGAASFTATPTVRVLVNSGLAVGTYPLMTWGSTSGTVPTTADLTVTTLAFNTVAGLSVSGNTLNLVISAAQGLFLAFNSTGVPTSVTNSTGVELLSGTSSGFYLLETNNVKRHFNQVTDLGGGAYRFGIVGSPEQIVVQFDRKNDYLTCRFTSMSNFALQGERLYFGLTTTKLKALALDHMVAASNGASSVQVERVNLWEQVVQSPINLLGGFAIYHNISPAREDSTLIDLWTMEGLPHPKVAGDWNRAAAEAWLTNWINAAYDTSYLNIVPNNLSEHYTYTPYAAKMDAKAVYMWNLIWRGEYWLQYRQNDEINPIMYPNGLADMQAFKTSLTTDGRALMFHYLSGNIGEEDPEFAKPNVSTDLQSWGTVTLTAPISTTANTMIVQPAAGVKLPVIGGNLLLGPPAIPSYFDFKTFRIGSEWMSASSVTDLGNGTWQLNGVARGQWHTTTQSYSSGTSLRGYLRPYNQDFVPDPDSPLLTTIAARWATLSNTLGLRGSEFDGLENQAATGNWGTGKFTAQVYQNLDHPTVSNTSGGRPPEAWLEYHFNRVKDALGGSFQTRQHASFYLGDASWITPGIEEVENEMNKFFNVNNRGFSLGSYDVKGVAISTLTNHGLTDEVLALLKSWKNASLPMSATQRAAMNTFRPYLGARLAINGNHPWATALWRPDGSRLRKWYALGTDNYTHEWHYGQEHGSITPRFYVTNGQTQTLEVPAALDTGAQQTRIIGRVLPRFDDTNTGNINLMPYLGTTNLTVTRTNTTAADVWDDTRLTKYVISPLRDLSANRGLGLWVTGDNSGATLVLRLQRSTQSRDHVVPINFTGRRWIEIPTGEQGWRVKNWGWALATIHSLDYRYIDSIRIGIGHIPANTNCSVVLDGLVAMKETAEALVNPTITLGGQSVGVSGTIASGNHFILAPSGLFTVYNANWNVVSTQQLSGLLPASLTSFSMQSASSSSKIWLEVGVQASNETTSSPAYTSTWDGEGGDGLWTTAANWNGNVLPVAGKAIDINSTVTVDALGLGSGNLPSLATLNISGGATLTMSSGAIRLNGSTLNVASNGALTGAFWDLNNATVNFEAGAGATMTDWEQKGANVFGYKLNANGFTTLTPGRLRSGNNAVWSNATYNIDISAYNITNGTTIVLADYASHDAAFNGTFNPTVNITAGASGLSASLAFDTVNSKLVLTIDAAGNDAPVAQSQTVGTPVNTPINMVLRATDPESDPLAFTIVTAPLHGTLTGSGSNRLYTPSNNFTGSDTFTFIADDGSLNSNSGMMTVVTTPQTATELWSAYDSAIRNDALNAVVLANWTDGAIALKQIRYDLGTLAGTPANASPKIAAYYGYPTGGTNLPGIVQIHGGGQRADLNEVKYWAQQGYACISINWGGLPLNDGLLNTDWDGLAAGFVRTGVANAIHREPLEPAVYDDGHTLFDIPHPLNNSYLLNAYAARRALTFLSAQSNVNANKLGVTGHSMGGQTTMFTATDSRVTCVTPSVGGSGYLSEDFWGLPGSAVTHHAAVSTAYPDWYKRVASPESYWPNVQCPTLFLEGANDYNAPLDFVVKGMSLQPTNVPQQLAVAPHFNHRFDTPSYAARVLWQKTHLTDTFSFPQKAVAQLNLTQPDGIPVFSVWPDTSTPNTIVGVDIYYGYDRDPLNRFWRDAQAVQTNGHWEGKCPVYNLNEPLVAFAIVTYDCGFDLAMPAGYSSPTRKFSLASEVKMAYPPTLSTNGVLATEFHRRSIDDFARGFHDWYSLNPDNPVYWQYWTRKLNDPSWKGPAAGNLDLSVATTGSGNTLGIKLVTGSWNETAANTYVAVVSVAGSNNLSLPAGAFTNVGSGAALASWDNVKQLALVPGNMVNAALPVWTGAVPVFSNLRWTGGSFSLVNGVPSAWLASYGLEETDAAALSDSDHDGLLNWEEYLTGTDPVNRASAFKITSVGSAGNQRVVQWQAVAGKTYSVWFSEDLTDNSWTLKQTGITGVAPTTSATIPSTSSKGFFRIRVEP